MSAFLLYESTDSADYAAAVNRANREKGAARQRVATAPDQSTTTSEAVSDGTIGGPPPTATAAAPLLDPIFGGPEHLYRDPKVQPRAQYFQRHSASFLVSIPTVSTPTPLACRRSTGATAGKLWLDAVKECEANVEAILQQCSRDVNVQRQTTKFFDSSFFPGKQETVYPKNTSVTCSVAEPSTLVRVTDVYPSVSLEGKVGCCLFNELEHTAGNKDGGGGPGFSSTAVTGVSNCPVQGGVGDAYFLGAATALYHGSNNSPPEAVAAGRGEEGKGWLIRRLFAAYSVRHGVYGVVFYINGHWEWVIVDDIIPIDPRTRQPLYGCSDNANVMQLRSLANRQQGSSAGPQLLPEVWPIILEKAYAKIMGSWAAIDGGVFSEALIHLSGGIIKSTTMKEMATWSFEEFQAVVASARTAVGCMMTDTKPRNGIVPYHGYSVLRAYRSTEGAQFVRIRNPWGRGGEWTGAFADNGPEWKKHPALMDELQPVFKADGAFWILWEDFLLAFDELIQCEAPDPRQLVLSCYGVSPNAVAGGPGPASTEQKIYIAEIQTALPARAVLVVGQQDPDFIGHHETTAKSITDSQMQAEQESPVSAAIATEPSAASSSGLTRGSFPVCMLQLAAFNLDGIPPTRKKLTVAQLTKLARRVQYSCVTATSVVEGPRYDKVISLDCDLEPGIMAFVPLVTKGPPVGYFLRLLVPDAVNVDMWEVLDPTMTMLSSGTVRRSELLQKAGAASSDLERLVNNSAGCEDDSEELANASFDPLTKQGLGLRTQTPATEGVGEQKSGASAWLELALREEGYQNVPSTEQDVENINKLLGSGYEEAVLRAFQEEDLLSKGVLDSRTAHRAFARLLADSLLGSGVRRDLASSEVNEGVTIQKFAAMAYASMAAGLANGLLKQPEGAEEQQPPA